MNVASRELSQELHEVSEWRPGTLSTYWWLKGFTGQGEVWTCRQVEDEREIGKYDFPAYDLGFLIRRLPGVLLATSAGAETCTVEFGFGPDRRHASAATPENALCKLAIELHEAGVLQKDS